MSGTIPPLPNTPSWRGAQLPLLFARCCHYNRKVRTEADRGEAPGLDAEKLRENAQRGTSQKCSDNAIWALGYGGMTVATFR
jgi:hypothetical protein